MEPVDLGLAVALGRLDDGLDGRHRIPRPDPVAVVAAGIGDEALEPAAVRPRRVPGVDGEVVDGDEVRVEAGLRRRPQTAARRGRRPGRRGDESGDPRDPSATAARGRRSPRRGMAPWTQKPTDQPPTSRARGAARSSPRFVTPTEHPRRSAANAASRPIRPTPTTRMAPVERRRSRRRSDPGRRRRASAASRRTSRGRATRVERAPGRAGRGRGRGRARTALGEAVRGAGGGSGSPRRRRCRARRRPR